MSERINPINKSPLTQRQKELAFAVVFTDGWIEIQKGGKNARIGLQQADKNKQLFFLWYEQFKDLITEKTRNKMQKSPTYPDREGLHLSARTTVHPDLTKLHSAFFPQEGKKVAPKVSLMKEYLTWEVLAWMIMQDGSIKSSQSKGIEIHTMNFSYESVARFCIALREKLNILCKPTRELRKGKEYWTTYISGASHSLIEKEVKPLMLSDFVYKIPGSRVNVVSSKIKVEDNLSYIWYEDNKNATFREGTF